MLCSEATGYLRRAHLLPNGQENTPERLAQMKFERRLRTDIIDPTLKRINEVNVSRSDTFKL